MAMTFTVNLATTNVLSSRNPYSSNDLQGSNFAATRSTWYPNLLNNNFVHKDGDTVTVSGRYALYLKNNFSDQATTPSLRAYAFLTYVSGTA